MPDLASLLPYLRYVPWSLVWWALAVVVVASLFFVGYCGTMGLKARWATLHWSAKALCAPAVIALVVFDVLVNYSVSFATGWPIDWPAKWNETFSQRLARYHTDLQRPKWSAIAGFICDRWLDPFDPSGDHC